MESTEKHIPSHIIIGQILSTKGLDGHVRIRVHSDVQGRFEEGVLLNCGVKTFEIIEVSSLVGDQIVVRFDGVVSSDAAQDLIGLWITAPEQLEFDLPQDEYYHYQLVGLQVHTESGEELGTVTDIIETGSNDVYVVDGPTGQILLPAISKVIRSIDMTSGTMRVVLLKGMR